MFTEKEAFDFVMAVYQATKDEETSFEPIVKAFGIPKSRTSAVRNYFRKSGMIADKRGSKVGAQWEQKSPPTLVQVSGFHRWYTETYKDEKPAEDDFEAAVLARLEEVERKLTILYEALT